MTDEQKQELDEWYKNRFAPPWPFQTRFLTMEEFDYVEQIRAAEREKRIQELQRRLREEN